jgi:hypothetical protein
MYLVRCLLVFTKFPTSVHTVLMWSLNFSPVSILSTCVHQISHQCPYCLPVFTKFLTSVRIVYLCSSNFSAVSVLSTYVHQFLTVSILLPVFTKFLTSIHIVYLCSSHFSPVSILSTFVHQISHHCKYCLPVFKGGRDSKKKCRLKRYRCYITWGKYR